MKIIIERIRSEVERLIVKHEIEYTTAGYVMNELLSFLSDLEKECEKLINQDEDFRGEMREWVELMVGASFPEQDNDFISEEDYRSVIKQTARHFAQWQKEQDDKELSEKIASAYQLGLADKEKQMMKEAVEGEVVKDISNKLAVTAKINLDGFKFGQKVRIIIVKED